MIFVSDYVFGGAMTSIQRIKLRRRKTLSAALVCLVEIAVLATFGMAAAQTCDEGIWIDSVLDDGRLIRLEDGTLWEVSPLDIITSSLWLPFSDMIVCGNRLINEDDNEAVQCSKIALIFDCRRMSSASTRARGLC